MYLLQEFGLFINRSHNLSFFLFFMDQFAKKTYTAQLDLMFINGVPWDLVGSIYYLSSCTRT